MSDSLDFKERVRLWMFSCHSGLISVLSGFFYLLLNGVRGGICLSAHLMSMIFPQ